MTLRATTYTALAICSVLLAAGCGSSSAGSSPSTTPVQSSSTGSGTGSTAGITATTITIGQLADVGGPIPGLFQGAENGVAAWAAYVNSKGGIGGRKVVVDFQDSALNCATFKTGIQGLVKNVAALVGIASVADVCGNPTVVANPGLLDTPAFSANDQLYSMQNVVASTPFPPGFPTSGYLWVKNKYGASAVAKTAALYNDQSPADAGRERAAAETVGFKYLYTRGVGPTETNFTSDILRMKADGVQVVDMTATSVTYATNFLQQAAQQNFHPLAVIAPTAYNREFFQLLGNPSLGSNTVMPLSEAAFLAPNDGPEVATMTTWVNKVHPGAVMDVFTLYGWAAGLLFQQAVEKAEKTGSLTRGSILNAAKSITSFDANGLLPTENPGGRVPSNCVAVVGVDNGKFVRLDPAMGFDCSLGKYYFSAG